MKNTILFLFLSFFACNTGLFAQQADPATAMVKEAITTFFTYDAEAYGSYFNEDAELINPIGMRMQGKAMMNQMHERYFQSLAGQTGHAAIKEEQVYYLNPQIAVVTLHADTRSTDAAGQEVSSLSAVVMAVVKQNEDGIWKIQKFQITPIIPFDRPDQG